MQLLVFSHKVCWESKQSPSGWATDGGFALQVGQISSLFNNTTVIVPVDNSRISNGEVYFESNDIKLSPIIFNFGESNIRKIKVLLWALKNINFLIRLIKSHDVIHCPIPSDIGTIGMLLAFILRKPLFVRHCGNWFIQATIMERFWKWFMEKYAGGNNLFLATGGSPSQPSFKNNKIKWIFSSSLHENEIFKYSSNSRFNGDLKACIVCRMDKKKGVGVVLETIDRLRSMNYILYLTVVGDGPDLDFFKELAIDLKLEDLVTFVGKKNHTEVLGIMREHHFFIYPTMASEGFPKVILEAMSQGLVVFTTPVSVLQYFIKDGENGILIEKADSILFANQILSYHKKPTKLNSISKNAIYNSEKYTLNSWEKFIKNEMISTWPYLTFKN